MPEEENIGVIEDDIESDVVSNEEEARLTREMLDLVFASLTVMAPRIETSRPHPIPFIPFRGEPFRNTPFRGREILDERRSLSGLESLDVGQQQRELELQQAEQAAEARARELLERFLTPQQKEQAEIGSFIIEKGRLGTYEIPLDIDTVKFETDTEVSGELIKLLEERVPGIAEEEPKEHLACTLCFMSMRGLFGQIPWDDVVLTLLLHIRADNEKALWQKAGFYASVISIDGESLTARMFERQRYEHAAAGGGVPTGRGDAGIYYSMSPFAPTFSESMLNRGPPFRREPEYEVYMRDRDGVEAAGRLWDRLETVSNQNQQDERGGRKWQRLGYWMALVIRSLRGILR